MLDEPRETDDLARLLDGCKGAASRVGVPFRMTHAWSVTAPSPPPSRKRNTGLSWTAAAFTILIAVSYCGFDDSLAAKCSAIGVPANFSASKRAKSNSDVRGR